MLDEERLAGAELIPIDAARKEDGKDGCGRVDAHALGARHRAAVQG